MMQPQISIAPIVTPLPGEAPWLGVFVDGILIRGLKSLIADEGGDVLIVLDRDTVRFDHPVLPRPKPMYARGPLATDGQA